MIKEIDVLIVGGGMAGSALAFSLAKEHRVVVLEKQAQGASQDRVGESLPAAALRSLRALGLERVIDTKSHIGYHGVISIWGQGTPIRKDFLSTLEGSGLHVDRGLLNNSIRQAAIEAGVNFVFDTKLASLTRAGESWCASVAVADVPQAFSARFIVDASGRANVVGRKLGVKRTNLDRALAIHTRVPAFISRPESPRAKNYDHYQGSTLIEAVEDGWWYRAPLPNGGSVISFHTDSDLACARRMQSQDEWLNSLGATKLISNGLAMDEIDNINLTTCAANTSMPAQCAGDGWLAIGDAAVGFDPISSQGMFNALTTAVLAKRSIDQALYGDMNAMIEYAERIQGVLNAYLVNLTKFYRSEARWPQNEFWQRRHLI